VSRIFVSSWFRSSREEKELSAFRSVDEVSPSLVASRRRTIGGRNPGVAANCAIIGGGLRAVAAVSHRRQIAMDASAPRHSVAMAASKTAREAAAAAARRGVVLADRSADGHYRAVAE